MKTRYITLMTVTIILILLLAAWHIAYQQGFRMGIDAGREATYAELGLRDDIRFYDSDNNSLEWRLAPRGYFVHLAKDCYYVYIPNIEISDNYSERWWFYVDTSNLKQ